MQEVKFEIINKDEIHSRSANSIAEFANKHPSCDIKITIKDGRKADAKSTIEIIILRIIYKEKIKITVVGKKEKLAIKNLLNLLKYNFSKELEK
ncbi:HPr family phosphocarrier protein [Borreliella americana]|uniref:HPr family phosphocarrier protein n=1 Tax=Borreliella americana TaxID=478807 RepID=UPI001E423131|nr:HPr family phosphocarrier protein [Borreliella americana]MCD2331871.1 HPr family phosphocarrier protein [Borreliella americana]MCD2349314.1 HPr family phosphocarrier protein [Borreliella americana]MCD2382051.1 HPr family phosphocarrier protein [Borreliella americana]